MENMNEGMWGNEGKGKGESESTVKFIFLEAFEAEGVKTREGSRIFDSLVAKGHSISWSTKEDVGAIR